MQAFEIGANLEQNDRILYLSGDIDNCSVGETCKQLLSIIDIDRKGTEKYRHYDLKPIQLYVQSFGGSVNDMWALIDIIESSPTPIITYCSGYCMSAAALIFLAGHLRCMYKHSSIMFHQMTVGMVSKINDVHVTQEQMDEMHKDMVKYIKKHTKLKKKFFKKFNDQKEDVYLSPKKCLKYGICDEIIEEADWRERLLANIAEAEKEEQVEIVEED